MMWTVPPAVRLSYPFIGPRAVVPQVFQNIEDALVAFSHVPATRASAPTPARTNAPHSSAVASTRHGRRLLHGAGRFAVDEQQAHDRHELLVTREADR